MITPRTSLWGWISLQTIASRFGGKRLTVLIVAFVFVSAVVGFLRSNVMDGGPPSCVQDYINGYGIAGGYDTNRAAYCVDAIDNWCAENHPEDPESCSKAVETDGDDRNVEKYRR
ncbi:hypothetical protein EAO69_31300 [Streptomyces sp. me109]|nr:hypothetical protein EAO69_31300 [Streptomyces sp. me109]